MLRAKSLKKVFKRRTVKKFEIPHDSRPDPLEQEKEGLIFVHIHIPKTGGTTFNSILTNNFGEAHERFEGRFIQFFPKIDNGKMNAFTERYSGIDAVSSHSFTATLPYHSSKKRIVAIAFLRNPVDRFISNYFFQRMRFGVNRIEKELNLEEYIELKTRGNNKIHSYLKFITESDSRDALEYVKGLCDNGHLYLFDTYHMDSSLKFLQSRFPHSFTDLNFEVKNESIKDQEVTKRHREMIQENLWDSDLELMKLTERFR